jgi:hypothetical protein
MYHDDIGKPCKNQSNKGGDNGLQFVSTWNEFSQEQWNIVANGGNKKMLNYKTLNFWM